MSKYTTGEIAKLCGVTVRTVQYYDTRGILIPSELSEGGRRLYSEDDLKRMKIICFLRELDLPIDAISQILKEEHPEKVISLLVEQQETILSEEISEKQEKLAKIREMKSGLNGKSFSLESISDIAIIMQGKKNLKKMRWTMLFTGIPVTALQWFSIIFWIIRGIWWPFVIWVIVATLWGTIISRYYFKNVKYICPECHEVFKPTMREAFLANHTPTTRKLTCSQCGHKGFCVEIWGGDGK
jgi:DNA-binding transcriptional MerR regulator